MKKLILLIISLLLTVSLMTSCATLEGILDSLLGDGYSDSTDDGTAPDDDDNNKPDGGEQERTKLYTSFTIKNKNHEHICKLSERLRHCYL